MDALLGQSAGIVAVREAARQLLRTAAAGRHLPPVLIEGRTGTGKGLLARSLHEAGPRAKAPFVAVNCAAIPETLLEAELFGYERGAFTDARQAKPGLFQSAHRGTLFLDEVGLLPSALQAKLLSALEDKAIRRLGATRSEPVDAWILAATNEDLGRAVSERRFRQDLYHRLAVVKLALPPLRERRDDIIALAEHFLAQAAREYRAAPRTLDVSARDALLAYAWPGNVRELANVIERACLTFDSAVVTAAMLALTDTVDEASAPAEAGVDAPAEGVTRTRLVAALTETAWNIAQTARRLGVARNTVYALIERHGLSREDTASSRSGVTAAEPASVAPPPAASVPAVRWESRAVTFIGVRLTAPPGSDHKRARLLGTIRGKVQSFGGRVDGMSPTGLIAVFGLAAVESTANLGTEAALAIQKEAERAEIEDESLPAVRIGIHRVTGPVGIGGPAPEISADARREAWNALETLLEDGSAGAILVSGEAAATLGPRFALAPASGRDSGYRLLGLSEEPMAAVLVGRRDELELLSRRWEAARAGQGQIVEISGEAGIGKSRLLSELASKVAPTSAAFIGGRCLAATSGTPYFPVLDLVRALCRVRETDLPATIVDRIGLTLESTGLAFSESAPYLLHLLGIDTGSARLADLTAAVIRRRTFETVRQLLIGASAEQPLLIAVEDLHWIDPTSAAFFDFLVNGLAAAPILLVTTYRPPYRPPWRVDTTRIVLGPLSAPESVAIVRGILGHAGREDRLDAITARAEGNPFFLEELARADRERGDHASATNVPETIRDVLAARLARLAADPARVIATAAVVGKDVSIALLAEVTGLPERALGAILGMLERGEFLAKTSGGGDAGYTFKHVLTHDVAYSRIPADEQRALHARVLAAMERLYAELETEHVERLAHHAVAAGARDKAIAYLHQAGRKATQRSGNAEAIAYLRRALDLLAEVPPGPARTRQELMLQVALGAPMMMTRGYASSEVEAVFVRARELAGLVGEMVELFPALWGLWAFHVTRGDHAITVPLGHQILKLADAVALPSVSLHAHYALGAASFWAGDLVNAREHLERAIAVYDTRPALPPALRAAGDPGAACRVYLGLVLWHLGFPDLAVERAREGVALAEQLRHPFTQAYALAFAAGLHQLRRDPSATLECARESARLCVEQGFAHWLGMATILEGWALAETGAPERGLETIRGALADRVPKGAELGLPYYLSLVAEAETLAGRAANARTTLAEARDIAKRKSEGWWAAELMRREGELRLQSDGASALAGAQACFETAIEIARAQRARALELRAAMSLARLLQREGQTERACATLAPVYEWFKEGFATRDLVEARALLDELA